ncbi:10257_t:CDS:2 [Funneliformis geosporum]|uniref:9078_t:CDS:1 n=1 Tax=Funneliformis geosporum TaxID=1117311 RepID=A0A9W4SKP1_9GLOM|nr:9078_t:CDS:2 [Funneliformis geosporum]CAI2172042.1 10257_t:CDS:2 [Funneliformis geosporum]
MNVSYLPDLCMKEISTVLKDNPSGLYRCSLINRHWNQYFLPELWKEPFQAKARINTKRLIETLFLCLPPEEKECIQDFTNIPINSNPHSMYSKYIQVLNLRMLSQYIEKDFPRMHHQLIYEKLFHHFNSNSTNISKIIFFMGKKGKTTSNNYYNADHAGYPDLFLCPNAKNLSTLKEVEFYGIALSGLIFNCYKVCRDLQTITFYNTEEFPEMLSNFNEGYRGYKYFNLKNLIKSQRNLKNLNIQGFLVSENKYLYEAVNSQNLHSLYIRGDNVLSASRKVNLITLIATYCHNLKVFKISIIDEHVKFIPSLLSSCRRLEHVTFNTYDQIEVINIDLSEIGKTMPSSMNRFALKMSLYFTPENFKEFLINIKDQTNLKVLNFKRCRLFSNDHLDTLIKHGNGRLRKLKINNARKVDHEGLLRARKFVKIETPKI